MKNKMLRRVLAGAREFPSATRAFLQQTRAFWRGYDEWRVRPVWSTPRQTKSPPDLSNAFRAYFNAHVEGRGIWKWDHYFDIYERHFARFRGREVQILEIGIYSGGSLEMWRDYFGPRCQVYGVDIEPECKVYEGDSIKVLIGDQGDRVFWERVRQAVKRLDIVIDDGSHIPEHQIITFEELLPCLQPGGVYLCEDVHGPLNEFASYLYGFAHNLNAFDLRSADPDNNERRFVVRASPLQSAIRSIHFYPFVSVVEKADVPIFEFVAPKHGTQWQPFFK